MLKSLSVSFYSEFPLRKFVTVSDFLEIRGHTVGISEKYIGGK